MLERYSKKKQALQYLTECEYEKPSTCSVSLSTRFSPQSYLLFVHKNESEYEASVCYDTEEQKNYFHFGFTTVVSQCTAWTKGTLHNLLGVSIRKEK